jgi:phosphoribosylformylglycinamidine synthase
MCFADNNLGAKIDFSVLKKRHHQMPICRISELYFRQRRCCTGKQTKRKQCRFLQNGNCYYQATLDLGPSKLDIAKYRDIWFKKLRFIKNNLKTNGTSAFLIIKKSIKLYFSNTFHRKKPVIDSGNHV